MAKFKKIIIAAGVLLGVFTVMNVALLRMLPFPQQPAKGPVSEPAAMIEVGFHRPQKVQPVFSRITRRTRRDSSRAFFRNTIFADGQEIAWFKSDGDRIFDVDGGIPDGEIFFENLTTRTRGVESFWGGQRHGAYREYFPDGQLYFEKMYDQGRLLRLKEFFDSGQLRMDSDYSDALLVEEGAETGQGKVFLKNGILIYEWHLTGRDRNRYKKAYNHSGDLMEISYFDAQGRLVDQRRVERE